MTTQLHPDFPIAQADADTWKQPDPIADIIYALSTAGNEVELSDLASITDYDIKSDAGQWAPGGEVATELSMILVGTLTDGRWFALEAWNDYTGWGCQDGSDIYLGSSRDDVIRNGLTNDGRSALGLTLP